MQFSGFVSFQRAKERGKQLGVGVCHRPDREHDSVTPQEAAGAEAGGGGGGGGAGGGVT